MLSRFSNEVLSQGPSAVLPHHLSDAWLKRLQRLCDDFLDRNFAVDQCTESLEMGDPILLACVHEVLRHNRGSLPDLSAEELAENVTIYALSITMETIRRESQLIMTPPTLDDLLCLDRIVDFGKINPDFGQFLQRACIVSATRPAGGENWFQRFKRKILSRITAD